MSDRMNKSKLLSVRFTEKTYQRLVAYANKYYEGNISLVVRIFVRGSLIEADALKDTSHIHAVNQDQDIQGEAVNGREISYTSISRGGNITA